MKKPGRPRRDEVYKRLEAAVEELRHRFGGLPSPTEAPDIWKDIWFQEAHNSTAIEGNTLVLKQVAALLTEGRAVGNKQLGEYVEVRGYADAAQWVYGQAIEPDSRTGGHLLTLAEIRHVHHIALQPVWDVAPHPDATERERPGSFREHDIQRFPGGMAPPPWTDVPALMKDWLDDVRTLRKRTGQEVERVADLHARFERIHPFLDGNGRVGRLVTNLVLIRTGYPPAIVLKRDRIRYLAALRRADSGDAGALGELLARAIIDNLYRFIVPAVAGPARLVPLAALADKRASSNALRVAAIRGRLRAQRGTDGQWRSSRRWVDEYLRTRYKREP
ncbi:MAG: Fic family protein [Actinomycetota bacterium]